VLLKMASFLGGCPHFLFSTTPIIALQSTHIYELQETIDFTLYQSIFTPRFEVKSDK